VSGTIEYPNGTPPGITPEEIARGEVLLCQARPRSDLNVELRRAPVRTSNLALCEIVELKPLPLGALQLRLRILEGALPVNPGQFVDVRSHAGDATRVAVIGTADGELVVEASDDGSSLREWLGEHAVAGSELRVSGPFDRPR
jgi:hypothetical protein